jgi:nucleoside-diphosphate-sugar epimerase
MSDKTLFIFGLGYVGQYLGKALMTQGWRVRGTTRSAFQAQLLKDQGFEAIVWDGKRPLSAKSLEGVTHILVTIPPDEKGDVVLRYVNPLALSIKWIGYLSATSVYGDHQGAWVTETSALKPLSVRGHQRLLAETQWLALKDQDPAFPIHIFRLSGIYGPGRSVLDAIRGGSAQRIDKHGHAFSRIHVYDIVSTLRASMDAPAVGEIYNLADDEPAPSAEVIAYGCQLLGVDVPPLIPFEEAVVSPGLREFYAENKRVSNDKIRKSLGVRLLYPTYREGLEQCRLCY